VIENFKISELDESKFKPAIVLVPNEDLIAKFKQEVVERCSKDYDKDTLGEGSELALKKRMTKRVKQTYDITTHHKFSKLVEGMNEELIRTTFSNRRIIIDESHSFRYHEGELDEDEIGLGDNDNIAKRKEEIRQSNRMYNSILKLIDNISDSQIFLMTGTPMTNSVNEIASQLNLILPPEDRFPLGKEFERYFFDESGNFLGDKKSEFMNKLIGKVSYLREPFIKKRYLGNKIQPWINFTNVIPLEMSERQTSVVEALYGNRSGFDRTPMMASISIQAPTRENFPNIKEFAVKFEYIRKLVIDAKRKRECVWIACDFVTSEDKGSLETLSMMLRLMGYSQVTHSSDISFNASSDKFIRIDQTSSDVEAILLRHNDARNKYGDFNRIIIGGPRAKLGLSLSHIRQIVKMNPDWHKADENQFVARGIRYGSLNALPENERYTHIHLLCAVKNGFIDFYNSKNGEDFSEQEKERWETVDMHVFNISESKEKLISQVTRLLKRVALDCAVNYDRNYRRDDDEDFSPECDYEECGWKCYTHSPDGEEIDPDSGLDPDEIQPTNPDNNIHNYNILHSSKEIRLIIKRLKMIFQQTFCLSYFKLRDILQPTSDIVLLLALDELIGGRVKIKDRYGFDRYLHEDMNYYYLSTTFKKGSYSDYFYTKFPIATMKKTIGDILSGIENTADLKLFREVPSSRNH
jgi:hypothetical protein